MSIKNIEKNMARNYNVSGFLLHTDLSKGRSLRDMLMDMDGRKPRRATCDLDLARGGEGIEVLRAQSPECIAREELSQHLERCVEGRLRRYLCGLIRVKQPGGNALHLRSRQFASGGVEV